MRLVTINVSKKITKIHYFHYECGIEQLPEIYHRVNKTRYEIEDIPQDWLFAQTRDLLKKYL